MAPNDNGAGNANPDPPSLRITISDARELIPEFSGSKNDLNRFISCCDSLFNTANNARDRALFFSVLKTKVSGPAYDIIDYGDVNGWEELKALLLKRYKLSRTTVREELKRLKQGPKESVNDFSLRVTRTLGELNKATVTSVTDANARTIFLQENEKEAIRVFETGLRNDRLQTLAQAKNETELGSLIDYVLERSAHIEDRGQKDYQGEGTSRQVPTCEVCHKRGHTRETCFRNKIIPTFSGQQIKREVRRLQCSYCNRPNHDVSECRARRSDYNRRIHDQPGRRNPRLNYNHNNEPWQQQQPLYSQSLSRDRRQTHYRPDEGQGRRPIRPTSPNQRRYDQSQSNLRQVRFINQNNNYDSGNEISREGIFGHPTRSLEVQADTHQQN